MTRDYNERGESSEKSLFTALKRSRFILAL